MTGFGCSRGADAAARPTAQLARPRPELDDARAASLAEYRNRHYVYQFTQAGYRAYRAVEDVLGASVDAPSRRGWSSPNCWTTWCGWPAGERRRRREEAYRKLNRLDSALADMAERAARFYLLLGDL